nr:hypothetical protein [Tanacetum cinerariifolium]
MFEKQADQIQTFHACKQEEGKPVGLYVIKMKNYMAQLECLGYVLPQDLSVGLILNGLTSDFVGFDYALESAARILNMVPTKKVDKTPYELWFGKVSNLSYLKVWGCEALVKRDTPDKLQQRSVKVYLYMIPKGNDGSQWGARELEEIQDDNTSPSKITSEIPIEVEGFEPPQEEEAHVRRSERPHRAPNCLCLNVEVRSIV